jgi:transcription antitermination factor NusG
MPNGDSMRDAKEWYAVYTKPRWEKKVFAALERQDITAYCPLNKSVRQWSDRKKTVELPLFTSYVFVQIGRAEELKVRMTPGVVNFVYWLGKIAVIRDEEMESLKAFVAANNNIRVERLAYSKGDIIEIESGPLKGQQALVKDVRKNKLELILKSMNVKLVVDLPNRK